MQEFKLDINERAYQLALSSIRLFSAVSWQQMVTSIIVKQLMRSITSIGANITEAKVRLRGRIFKILLDTHLYRVMKVFSGFVC